MFVVTEFIDEFETVPFGTKITVDADYNETVENIKVLLSLKHHDLDISRLRLYYKGNALKDSDRLSDLGVKDGTVLQARGKAALCGCF